LDNSNKIRRKAQKLTQQGAYAEAVAEYDKLSEKGALEPYDLVIFADLLNRGGRKAESVERYLQAMDSYAESGLHRNAIALGKKIQRMDPDVVLAHRKLGDLYALDGLASESCLHYLEFLEKASTGTSEEVRQVEDVCQRLLDLSLPSFDIVDRIVEKARAVDKAVGLASGVLQQAERAAALGNEEAESRLRELASALDPNLNGIPTPPGVNTDSLPMEPGVMELEGALSGGTGEAAAADEPPMLSLDDAPAAESGAAPESLSVEDVFAPPAPGLSDPAPGIETSSEIPSASTLEDSPVIDDSPAMDEAPAPAKTPASADAPPSSSHDGVTYRARGLHALEMNDPTKAQRDFMKGAQIHFDAAQTQAAAELYELVVKIDPNHLEALKGLVEIAHINGERSKMARWGCELGDVLLAREMYAEAKVQFERVLAFDAGNEKALARLKRLNTMVGVKEANFGKLTANPSEVRGAQVTIRDDEAEPQSQFTLNLSQILEEFRAAVVERIPVDDGQSHHDLGMTYMEMGLIEEAATEFETASQDDSNRLASLEMLGECYLLLNRPTDAMTVFEDLLGTTPDDDSKARTYLNMGRAREALGEWDQAEDDYHEALKYREDLAEASELLRDLEQRREQGAA
jgi:tetratricopeptide (TPR) repeat protein